MKSVIVLTALYIGVINCYSDYSLWTDFKAKHLKTYCLHEEQTRFSVFQQNLRKIEQHNARYIKGEASYFLTITKFADWTKEEVQKFLRPLPENKLALRSVDQNPVRADYPDSFDCRDHGAVIEIQDQGQCLSGWAFAAAGAVEGRYAALEKKLIALSAEELIDCSTYENTKA
ncbi:cathepsin L-like proteinase [Diabrotica virgifera virgifera]|uniref:Cathepsin propeptide inhibitor domain-containing protein n=1 Tax=Diabrotica virgifera virgifera TaxID=50390 RepID=A0ABM5IVL2_DIAVI|nr:cathepsin L-like proteinase [Diabrotica virgifera virgifera]